MAISDYSTSAAANTAISGINIAENCPAANMNNAQRQLMADVKTFYNSAQAAMVGGRVPPHADFTTYMPDVTIISGDDGKATVAQDLDALFTTTYSPSATVKYVAPWGSDANGGTSWADAYLTGAKIRTVTCGTAYFAPGEYDPFDWRYTDTAGTAARRFVAPFGGAKLRTSGTAVSGLAFSANATYAEVYEAALADPPIVLRLLRTDILDSVGLPTPMPMFATLLALHTAGYGWCHDLTANKLYVCVGTTNINTSFKAYLSAIYINTNNNQNLLYSSISYWEGFTFEGGAMYGLLVAAQAQPVAFFKNCRSQYSLSHAFLAEGAKFYSQNCTVYRSGGDGANYNVGTGNGPSYFLENNFRTLYCGDEDSYPGQVNNPAGAGYNKQGSSSHDALGVRVGGGHDGHAGQLVADAMSAAIRPRTWTMGTEFGRSRAPISSNISYGFYQQNADAYVENVTVPDCGNGAIYSDGNAVINYYNMRGTRAGAGTFTAYTPTTT